MKVQFNIKRLFLYSLVLLVQVGCYKDNKETMYPTNTTTCDTSNTTWSKDIKPIVDNACATSGCHNGIASGGYDLSTYAGVKTMVTNNRFLSVIELGTMPKGAPKLDDCSINKVRSWMNKGALQN